MIRRLEPSMSTRSEYGIHQRRRKQFLTPMATAPSDARPKCIGRSAKALRLDNRPDVFIVYQTVITAWSAT